MEWRRRGCIEKLCRAYLTRNLNLELADHDWPVPDISDVANYIERIGDVVFSEPANNGRVIAFLDFVLRISETAGVEECIPPAVNVLVKSSFNPFKDEGVVDKFVNTCAYIIYNLFLQYYLCHSLSSSRWIDYLNTL